MAEIDYSLPERRLDNLERKAGAGLKSGGGGGRFDPMEPRVKALEDQFLRMDSKLDAITTDLAYIKGRFENLPTAAAFGEIKGSIGELKGRVDSLPTTAKIAGLIAIGVGVLTVITKWSEIMASLPG